MITPKKKLKKMLSAGINWEFFSFSGKIFHILKAIWYQKCPKFKLLPQTVAHFLIYHELLFLLQLNHLQMKLLKLNHELKNSSLKSTIEQSSCNQTLATFFYPCMFFSFFIKRSMSSSKQNLKSIWTPKNYQHH